MSEFITAENLDLIIKENCKIRDEVSEQVDKIKTNTEIEIECDGEDEDKAMEEILKAFENNLGE